MRILVHVLHLFGTGHHSRMAAICRHLSRLSVKVTYVTGSVLPAGIDLGGAERVKLPPVRVSDIESFDLVDDRGQPVDERWRAARRDSLLAAFNRTRPDMVVTELFPFGRCKFHFELIPLLEAARSAPFPVRTVASVRDILVPSTAERMAVAIGLARRYYDRVLVHADPRVVRLEASFPPAVFLADLIDYTGYVASGPSRRQKTRRRGVVVSTGSGGRHRGVGMLESAIRAREQTVLAKAPWRLLVVAPAVPRREIERLRRLVPGGENILLEHHRPDFADLLAGAELSISRGGYNTMIDVALAGPISVTVPYSHQGEDEQRQRAQRFEELGLTTVATSCRPGQSGGHISPETLAAAVHRALAAPRETVPVDIRGARKTAEILSCMLNSESARGRPTGA